MILLLIIFVWGAVFTNGPLMYKVIIIFLILERLKINNYKNNNDYILIGHGVTDLLLVWETKLHIIFRSLLNIF